MPKMNCWEFHMCGREPGGKHVSELGVCPAAVETSIDGFNQGKNGGRACWSISGTLCDGKVQSKFSDKLEACKKCRFFKLVLLQQGCKLQDTREIRRTLLLEDLKRDLGEDYKEKLDLKIRALKGRRENMPKLNCWRKADMADNIPPENHKSCGNRQWSKTPSHSHRCASAIRPDGANSR